MLGCFVGMRFTFVFWAAQRAMNNYFGAFATADLSAKVIDEEITYTVVSIEDVQYFQFTVHTLTRQHALECTLADK
jgi:type III secretory pathway component EscT